MTPVAVFIAWSLVVGECYPLSNYSMYSNPTPRPLRVYYVVDGEGRPLPIQWHTGQSPAAITKTFRHYESGIEREIRRGVREPVAVAAIQAEAGALVLAWLRELSMARAASRPGRQLEGTIRLVEITISAPARTLLEEHRAVATDTGAVMWPDTGGAPGAAHSWPAGALSRRDPGPRGGQDTGAFPGTL